MAEQQARRRDNRSALPLVLPFIAVYGALFVYPSAQMVLMSFTDSSLTRAGDWIGLGNFEQLLADRQFGVAVLNTLKFVLWTVIPGTLIALGLALVVSRLKGFWRAVALAAFFLPYILPVSTVASIAWWITDTENGPLGWIVHRPNGARVQVWYVTALFLPAVAVLTVWWTVGFSVLIYLAGLRAVPAEVYEAAQLDGAGRWALFRHVTWPLIWPVTGLVLTIQLILQMKVFDQIYLMLTGGPTNTNMVLVQYIYTIAFQRNDAGYASTVALALFVIVATVAVLQFQVLRLRSPK